MLHHKLLWSLKEQQKRRPWHVTVAQRLLYHWIGICVCRYQQWMFPALRLCDKLSLTYVSHVQINGNPKGQFILNHRPNMKNQILLEYSVAAFYANLKNCVI
jgi:hypothetical protein